MRRLRPREEADCLKPLGQTQQRSGKRDEDSGGEGRGSAIRGTWVLDLPVLSFSRSFSHSLDIHLPSPLSVPGSVLAFSGREQQTK